MIFLVPRRRNARAAGDEDERNPAMELSLTQFIDGIYQATGGPQEDPSGGFSHGGWSVPFGEEFSAFMTEVFDQADAFLLGRRHLPQQRHTGIRNLRIVIDVTPTTSPPTALMST
jgi:hypothetical protein